jgi:hypothetical protein
MREKHSYFAKMIQLISSSEHGILPRDSLLTLTRQRHSHRLTGLFHARLGHGLPDARTRYGCCAAPEPEGGPAGAQRELACAGGGRTPVRHHLEMLTPSHAIAR